MSIFLIKTPPLIHLLLVSCAGVFLALFPALGFSLEISTPVGVHQIGKHLDLKSTLSNMPEGAESQLRSTCLKARVVSLETPPNGNVDLGAREILVNFDPTIRNGGLLEFKSVAPVHDALIEIELLSECPLVVFATRWTLIMAQGELGRSSSSAEPNMKALQFDLQGSSLLALSRLPPSSTVQDAPGFLETKTQAVTIPDKEIVAPPKPTESNPEEGTSQLNEAVKVASLDTDLFGAGLIESRREMADASLGLSEPSSEYYSDQTWDNLMLPAALAMSALLALALIARKWQGLRASSKTVLNEGLNSQTRQAADVPSRDIASLNRDHVVAFSAEPALIGSHRVLESLMGNDEQGFDESLDESVHALHSSGVLDPANRSSLKISLELINRADIRSWILPSSYLGLVESRNRSLELHRTLDALLLRGHIGLVELAFQDAKQGHATHAQAALELLDQVLGEQIEEIESKPVLCVPDVVKSQVRAKMCEIAGAEKRQLLRENLVNLNNQVLSPALCFSSIAWREFLSEEGILE